MIKYILFKRPVITIFCFYSAFLILLNIIGIFEPQKQSFLYHFAAYNKLVEIEGKVIEPPEPVKNGQRFILKASRINGFRVSEKILVDSPAGYQIAYGDIINIEGRIYKPKKADFPLVFDYRQYLARLGIYTLFRVYSFEHIESKANPVKKFAFRLQRDIVKKIDNYFKKSYASVLKPVIIGDKSSLDAQTKENFTDAGLMHILVVSGLNVGFVGGLFLIIFKICGLSLKKASLLTIPFIVLYTLATGANPPVVRAAIMFSSVLIALSLDREPLIYNSLALSALLILLFQPQQLFTASFQMSYAATIGIVYFYNNIFGLFSGIKNIILKSLCGVLSVTVAAQIPIIPVCMYYFGKISMISFASNIIVVPLIGIITPLGFIFYFFTFISSHVSFALSLIISVLLHLILIAVHISANLDFSAVVVAKPTVFRVILFFIFLFFITHFKNKKRFIFSGACLAISFLYMIFPHFTAKSKAVFNVYDGNNIMTVQTISKGSHSFTLYMKTGKSDKYYMDSFKQFLSFSGIKRGKIYFIGFSEKDVPAQSKNMDLFFDGSEKPEILEINFHNAKIIFDPKKEKAYIGENSAADLKDNPSFYYYYADKEFKIKSPRK